MAPKEQPPRKLSGKRTDKSITLWKEIDFRRRSKALRQKYRWGTKLSAMQEKYIKINNLQVSEKLSNFVNDELLKSTNVSSENFWLGLEKTLDDLVPKNKQLIKLREDLQKKIDDWHIKTKGKDFNLDKYKKFLLEIGYLKNEGPDFKIETENVDEEIASIAGPQLVVPVMNARYALNAANARWMSLYDSLYGTDIIEQSEDSVSERYDPLEVKWL